MMQDLMIFRETVYKRGAGNIATVDNNPDPGDWKFRLVDRDSSEASCGENRPTYNFIRYLELDEVRELILSGQASNMTGMKFEKPRYRRVKAVSRRVN